MKKFYAFLAGFIFCLAGSLSTHARTVTPDVANFTFAIDHPNNNVFFTNTSTIGSEPGIRHAFWNFGDGIIQMTGPLDNAQHHYQVAGTYNVCLRIYRYRPNLGDSVLSAYICKTVVIQTVCNAEFISLAIAANPLLKYFVAQPSHNQNKKPLQVCWQFGDGRDTCINYSTTYTGAYAVNHLYAQTGNYNVCVNIHYDGGCQAQKCHPVQVGRPDTCHADFERIPSAGANPLLAYYKALPQHNNNRKPSKVCWIFGDGRDTCINYPETYTGQYVVSHTYLHPGQYQVCVQITYYGGCVASKCKPIQIGQPDSCAADFERIQSTGTNPLLAYYKALPSHNNNRKPSKVCWTFGEGGRGDTCINYSETYTGQYVTSHTYLHPGQYQVCVQITYFGGCVAYKCKPIQIGIPDSCGANFERIPSPTADPRRAYYRALPWHSNNNKPSRICWTFGDGQDTCINYTASYTGQYVVAHNYQQTGLYQVCVNILYFGGCEAHNCRPVQIGNPDSCSADFERGPNPGTSPLTIGLKALPWNNNNRKPSRVCWTFGDGRDTCINYPENYTGLYNVVHTYPHPGQYQVCVNIRYYGGCEASRCKPIVVPTPQPGCAVTLFEITPSITSLVRGFMAIPTSNPPSNKPVRVCWYFGDGQDTCIMVDTVQPHPFFTISHTYPGPGVYHACVSVLFQGGCTAYNCREVNILGNPRICGGYMTDSLIGPRAYNFRGFSIHAPNDQVIGFHWTFGDGTSANGQTVTHTYSQPGNYPVCLIINTQLGCETRICRPLHVQGNNQPALILSPNPVINILHVDFFSTHTEQVNIRILNITGNVVRNYVRNVTVGPNNWTYDLSSLLPGVYSFVVQSPNQLASAIFVKL
jgi:PKD repeat protein